MSLFPATIWIFLFILLLLLIVAVFPSPAMIGLTISIGSMLVLAQAYIVLKDRGGEQS